MAVPLEHLHEDFAARRSCEARADLAGGEKQEDSAKRGEEKGYKGRRNENGIKGFDESLGLGMVKTID